MTDKSEAISNRINASISKHFATLAPYIDDVLLWPELGYIKNEIIDCLLIGANQAAITLTNHFLEKILKTGLVYNSTGGKRIQFGNQMETYESAIKQFGELDLFNSIKTALELKLIDELTSNALNKYRKEVRNAFSHADARKTFGDLTAISAITPTKNSNRYSLSINTIASMPYIHGMAQQILAEDMAFDYFKTVYGALKMIETNVERPD